jgi:IS5 family transposase
VLDAKDRIVYAGNVYLSKKHTRWPPWCGIEDRMIARTSRNETLTDVQKTQSLLWAGTHCTFGILMRHNGMAKMRYFGLKRNAMYIGYNMKRGLNLLRECVA